MAYDEKLADRIRRCGRPMNGYVFVGPAGSRTEKAVRKWVDWSTAFVAGLEGRAATRSRKPRARRKP